MKYTFDSGTLINLKHYYNSIFESFWTNFNELVESDGIISTKEVFNEIVKRGDFVSDWAAQNKKIFKTPTHDEILSVRDILRKHKELIRRKKILEGAPVADPFLIAQAHCNNLILVTTEILTPNGHKIPNICEEMDIKYMNVDEFMQNEGWKF